jgi:hypothetical protein
MSLRPKVRVLRACAVAALVAGSVIAARDIASRPSRMAAGLQLAWLTALQRSNRLAAASPASVPETC